MNTTSGPPLDPPPHDSHLLGPLFDRLEREPDTVIAARRHGDQFVDVTVKEVAESVLRLAKGFLASGVAPGDRVALMSHTRLEWALLDYAILAAGGVTVPIYDTSSADQIRWIIEDSDAVMFVVETPTMFGDFDQIRLDVPGCRETLVIDDGALDELERRGAGVADSSVEERIATLDLDSIATIIYTSGTTGRPKG
ncbi:MAG TPA: AMP-binding protein, partial [Ilumatobacteraceae bacterium]|nr:AMP-binding protein [Ilumatobacteraceae bacterium]